MIKLIIIFTTRLSSYSCAIPSRSSGFVIINLLQEQQKAHCCRLPYYRNRLQFNNRILVSHIMLAAGTIIDEPKNNILLLLRRYTSGSLALCWLHVHKNRCPKKKESGTFFQNLLYITFFVLFLIFLRNH